MRISGDGLQQAAPGPLEAIFAGAEANVAASLAMLGAEAAFVTALPRAHPLADSCVQTLRGVGIDTRGIVRTDSGRFGIFYVESGANQIGDSGRCGRTSVNASGQKPRQATASLDRVTFAVSISCYAFPIRRYPNRTPPFYTKGNNPCQE